MRLIVSIIQPQQLPAVKKGLNAAGVPNLTCTNVLGTSPHEVEHHAFRGVEFDVELFQKVRVEVALKAEDVDGAVEAIVAACKQTGGFGKIFISELTDCISVKDGKKGRDAI